jgi:hypothetical protein
VLVGPVFMPIREVVLDFIQMFWLFQKGSVLHESKSTEPGEVENNTG